MINSIILKKITNYCKKNNISITKFCAKSNFSRHKYYLLEQNKYELKINEFISILNVLQLSIVDILGEEKNNKIFKNISEKEISDYAKTLSVEEKISLVKTILK